MGTNLEMEVMLAKVQSASFEDRIKELQKSAASSDTIIRDKLSKVLSDSSSSNPALDEMRKNALNEQLDGKIKGAFEQLRNDNLFIWK